MRLLTIGAEYRGPLNLFGCGITSANVFEKQVLETFDETPTMHLRLRGTECTSDKIIKYFRVILSNLDNENVFIYYAGHGNKIRNREYWHTSCGNVDQIKIASLINEINDD